MLKRYLNYLKYTFTKGTGSDSYDVLLAVVPIGTIILVILMLLEGLLWLFIKFAERVMEIQNKKR